MKVYTSCELVVEVGWKRKILTDSSLDSFIYHSYSIFKFSIFMNNMDFSFSDLKNFNEMVLL